MKTETKPVAAGKRTAAGARGAPAGKRGGRTATSSCPIVGIGASAGGLEAMTALLKHLPADAGLALVLVQHMDPTHESALPALLARATQMPVAEVIDSLQTREIEVQDEDGQWWSVRIRPYRTTDHKIDGAVIAMVDIDLLKTGIERIRQGRELAEEVVETVRQPLVMLDEDLVVQQANAAFCRAFQLRSEDVLHRRIYELADGRWNSPKLRPALEEVLPHNGGTHELALDYDFPQTGPRRIRLALRRLACAGGRPQMILLAVEEAGA